MKSSHMILSLLLASIIASAAVPASAMFNLLQNPGFETGDFPPWQHGNITGMVLISSPGHKGNYMASLSAEGAAWLFQEINPPRCAKFLEFWYRGLSWTAIVTYSDGTVLIENLPTSEAWTLVHIDLDTHRLVKTVKIDTVGGKDDVDDFSLEACVMTVGGVVSTAFSNAFMALVVIAAASIPLVLGYRFTKRYPSL